jgi:hypothetical protein
MDDVIVVTREEFLAGRHGRSLPEGAECVEKIKETMLKVCRRRPGPGRGGGRHGSGRGRGRGGGRETWTRAIVQGKRPLKAERAEPARDLAAACNKLSASNFDKIYSSIQEIVKGAEHLLDALFDSAVGSGSFGELYIRIFERLRGNMPDQVQSAVTRAADKFAAAGGIVMPYADATPDKYDEFCNHAKVRKDRLSTLGLLVNLGVQSAAEDAIMAFEKHLTQDAAPVIQLDLVVDGLAKVQSLRPDMRARVDDLTRTALTSGGSDSLDARTRFKLLDVAESCKNTRRPRGARPAC